MTDALRCLCKENISQSKETKTAIPALGRLRICWSIGKLVGLQRFWKLPQTFKSFVFCMLQNEYTQELHMTPIMGFAIFKDTPVDNLPDRATN